jgi:hypothetical protein
MSCSPEVCLLNASLASGGAQGLTARKGFLRSPRARIRGPAGPEHDARPRIYQDANEGIGTFRGKGSATGGDLGLTSGPHRLVAVREGPRFDQAEDQGGGVRGGVRSHRTFRHGSNLWQGRSSARPC